MRSVPSVTTLLVAVFTSAASAGTISVPAGSDLQAALDAAVPGDVLLLQPGAEYVGNFVIRSGKTGLTIRSAAPAASLPGPGVRTSPAFSPYLPKLRSPNASPALDIAPGASFITLENLEFLASSSGSGTLIELGAVDATQTSVADAPHDLVLDRLLVNVPEGVPQKRGISLNSASTTIRNCYLYGLKYDGADAQAIAGWNGPGPFVIDNNRLTASGENLMFGGSDPTILDLVPTDIRVTRNHLDKPLAWKGSVWDVKNIFELKNAQDVVVEGNILEYNWMAAQPGFAVVLTPRNQYGGAPWTVVQRVRFRNNIVRHVAAAVNLLGFDNNATSQQTNDILIENNLFEDVDWTAYGGSARVLQLNEVPNVTFRNNTSPHNDGALVYAYGKPSVGLVLENNLTNAGNYAIKADGTQEGNATIAGWLPGASVLNNAVVAVAYPSLYPAGNYYPRTWSDVGMDATYRLTELSPYYGLGVGANMDAIEAAITGTVPAPVPPPPPPPCTFTVTPAALSLPSIAGSALVTVAPSDTSCTWDASSNASWLTAQSTSSGATLWVTANTGSTTRTGTATVAGVTVTVSQDAPPPPACTFVVTPTSLSLPSTAGSALVSVKASDPVCTWSATSGVSWLTADATSTGATLTYSANPSRGATRTGTATVAGVIVTVSQAKKKGK